jgi:MoaA/NifB/PqqE/SkfB family radical SAM enzyme
MDNRNIILDGQKLPWHKDRVEAWLNGERIVPITLGWALTRACNYKCEFCYSQLQENQRKPITQKVIFDFQDDAAEVGVKAMSFVSDGESTCSPYLYEAITHGKQAGLDMALGTNGALLKPERLEEILPSLTYLRFNISAGEPGRYKEIHGCMDGDFEKVCHNIQECARIKKEKGLQTTIGMQMVFLPKYFDQVMPLARLGKQLGADYLVIKHCSDDEEGQLGVDYKGYSDEQIIEELKNAESISTEKYAVKAKWSKILSGGKRTYNRCYGPPFMSEYSGSGLVATCGFLFNDKYKEKFHIANLAEQRFKDIVKSDRYWELMDYLASKRFDPKTMCGTLCMQHKINEYLFALKEGRIKLETPKGEPPMHVNFI